MMDSSQTCKVSYCTTLELHDASFPGLWSTIKRSTAAEVKNETFASVGCQGVGGQSMNQQTVEIMARMKANNYEVADVGIVIAFRGEVSRSSSKAFFLTFCTGIGLASMFLVSQIQF